MSPRQFSDSKHDSLVAELALHPPKNFRVSSVEDLARIPFRNGVAAVLASPDLLEQIPFKNETREESPRLAALRAAIRREGYAPLEPIIARVGQKGRWVIVDGGHRITALRQMMAHPLQRCRPLRKLFGRPIGDVYFLLYLTPRSWAKSGRPEDAPPPE